MSREDDQLDDLGSAWRDVKPREPGGALEREDPSTRAVVSWMQEAWGAIEAPAPLIPIKRPTPGAAFPRLALRYAAAAMLLVAAVFGVKLLSETDKHEDITPPALTQETTTETTTETAAAEAAPKILMATEERVVMRSGPVRLILVQGTVSEEE